LGTHQPIYLTLWAEVVGIFQGISSDDLYTYVEIDNKLLLFPRESMESRIILNKLNRALIGKKIAMLKTDSPQQPIIIKPFTVTTEAVKRRSQDGRYSYSLKR